ISASIGAGHDGAAREMAERLARRGFRVERLDLLSVFPHWLGTTLRGTYRAMLTRQPWIYAVLYRIACGFAGAGDRRRRRPDVDAADGSLGPRRDGRPGAAAGDPCRQRWSVVRPGSRHPPHWTAAAPTIGRRRTPPAARPRPRRAVGIRPH